MSYPSSNLVPASTVFPGTTVVVDPGEEEPPTGYTIAYPSSTTYPSNFILPGTGSDEEEPPGEEEPPVEVVPHRIVWNLVQDRQIETGVDRGVLYLKNGVTVPWNGLTGVDEEGGEGAAEYFIDGRPFLYLPKPKEFKANIRAFMYPDEFSLALGEVEITDGMYLDSQIGDSFDLSYRTKIYNSLGEYGYKIHLIYNATVVPSARSYGTIGEQINPVEFSWDIQAVPIRVDGYRPTAHITIDTRHMDATRLNQLENLLYGTPDDAAAMPEAQAIFDLLTFGDAIVITDNGDGTWTAEGSYKNIYMIGDEIFQIDNVDAVDHGDGTFTVSSTP